MFIYHFNRLIRNRILWGLFAIIIAFAFVAVDSCFRQPPESQNAGLLDGVKIPENEFFRVAQSIRGFGRDRNNDLTVATVDRMAWEQIAAKQTLKRAGLVSTKNEVRDSLREMPAFQGDNGFDMQRYRMILAEHGMTPAIYEELVEHQLTMVKCGAVIDSASWVSPMELEDDLVALTDLFTVRSAQISNKFTNAEMNLKDEDYKQYYEDNKNTFMLPDRVAVKYVAVPVTNFIKHVSVSEEELLDYYDSHAETYVRSVTNDVSEPIPFAEVRDKIQQELLLEEARYAAGTAITFRVYGSLMETPDQALERLAVEQGAAVKTSPFFNAKERLYWVKESDDFVSAAFELDPERADMRFGLVKGDDFIYVIEQAEYSAAHLPEFESVAADLKSQAVRSAREKAFNESCEKLRTEIATLVEGGSDFVAAAQTNGLSVSTSLTYSVSSISEKSFEHNYNIAYGAMHCKQGEISESIYVSPDVALLVYVAERSPGDALSAEMMRGQVRSSIARRRGSTLLESWLGWNLAQRDFNPLRPLASEEDEGTTLDDDGSELL